jgi:predicted CXXCH cytochrome family protein
MKPANSDTVLGDFDNATYTHAGVTTSFTRDERSFFVNTQNRDGENKTFKIAYTFGVYPLQQYLIGFPDGRYQALTVAWDSRAIEEGGQRWYQLMPDDIGEPGTSLHWTGAYYNWNAMCAECHSTGLEKNYSVQTNSYQTTWTDINVSCESCHGPGSEHSAQPTKPLPVNYSPQLQWQIAEGASIASPLGNPHPGAKVEIESCAGCHSRRSMISDGPINGSSASDDFLNHFQLHGMREDLYHADGQILDEVYVYGSFIQSKMFQRGVSCSNCHDPHSLQLKAPGNGVCASCHASEVYDTAEHHFHRAGNGSATQCVDCHMPSKLYMGVDARRDHSMRVPDPLLAEAINAPDVCTDCHVDKSKQWAGNAITHWLQQKNQIQTKPADYAEAIFAARKGQNGAEQGLIAIVNNLSTNSMARSAALELLRNYPVRTSYQTALSQLKDRDALVRVGALRTLEFLPQEQRWSAIAPLLNDKIAMVRHEATRLLLASKPQNSNDKALLQHSIKNYMASLMIAADMPLGQVNIGNAYRSQGLYTQAYQAYDHALKLDPYNLPAIINQADNYRLQGLNDKSLQQLILANTKIPDSALLRYSLGLAQVRSQQPSKAIENLAKAAVLEPDTARYGYTYALALNSQGQSKAAIEQLKKSLKYNPHDRDLLLALVTITRDSGKTAQAKAYAKQLLDLFPTDRALEGLYNSL